ncbi:patatin-like phospholipase domain-containing protein 4 isoform X1 [Corythoichthys intestinalis]|uniref:patatin-like phospholipase domain-containing protein 4 isoform X1 n=1 Tax=Corythoichthys intestinalis TaxID=161448 RepID=UPI0025A6770E|nr:patatin-like phospholipase domain-containing protein 4 isoform X1 [Corythoichthys intestinalis]XP_057712067.1 patatin-like phospholipase domain-containing protein 4 isoform X1 [Corythoichthys intestinalis]
MTVVNLSFAACGFLGIYHLGAAGAFFRHGQKLLTCLKSCAGSSAGALVAAVILTAPDKVKHCEEFTYNFAEDVRQQRFGAITPGYNVLTKLREGIEEMLPVDAHSQASGRLYVSMTHFRSGKNHIVSQFNSREELIQALLASSFVPVYAGLQPVEFRGQKWIDGGFTDSLPIMPSGRTITVSPFSGPQDVSPLHKGYAFKTQLKLANMNIMFSMENIKRLNQALFPPSTNGMKSLCQEGFDDAMRFLKTESWMS